MAKDDLKQTKSVADEHAKQDAEAEAQRLANEQLNNDNLADPEKQAAVNEQKAPPPPVPENQGREVQALDEDALDQAVKAADEKFAIADQALADILTEVANVITITTGGPKQMRAQSASNDIAQLRDKLKLARNMLQG